MPIPVPKSEDDLSACIRFVKKEGIRGEKPSNEQAVAVCINVYKRHQRKGKK